MDILLSCVLIEYLFFSLVYLQITSIKDAIEDMQTEMETQRIEHLGKYVKKCFNLTQIVASSCMIRQTTMPSSL